MTLRRTLPCVVLLFPAAFVPGADPPRPGDAPARTDFYGDPLPPGAVARLGTVRLHKPGGVHDVSFSPDNRHAVSCNGTALLLWDRANGRLARALQIPFAEQDSPKDDSPFHCYALSADGRTAASANGLGGRVYLWDLATGRLRRRIPVPGERLKSLAVSHDGRRVACGRNDGAVLVWEADRAEPREFPAGRRAPVVALAFAAGGKQLATLDEPGGGIGQEVRLLEVATGRVARRFAVGKPSWADLAPDGWALATWDAADGLRLWDVATGATRRLLPGGERAGCEVRFAAGGRTLVTKDCEGGLVRLWDAEAGAERRRLGGPGRTPVPGTALSPDGRTLAGMGGRFGVLRLWDAATGRPLLDHPGHGWTPEALAFSPDGTAVITVSDSDPDGNTEVLRWEASGGRPLSRARAACGGRGDTVRRLLSPGGSRGARVADRGVELFDCRTGATLRELAGGGEPLEDAAFSPDGRLLAAADRAGGVRVWDAASGRQAWAAGLGGCSGRRCWVAFAPGCRTLAAGGGPPGVRLWDAATGRPLGELGGERGGPEAEGEMPPGTSGCFAPDGRTVFEYADGRPRAWDVATRREGPAFESCEAADPVWALRLATSPDGRLVAGFRLYGTSYFWEAASGRLVRALSAEMSAVAFAPDGRRVAGGCWEDGSVLVWDLPGLFRLGGPRPSPARAWEDLAEKDPRTALCTVGWLAADEKLTLAALGERLRPAQSPPEGLVNSLVEELDGGDFAAREGAERRLAEMGEAAVPRLRRAAEGGASPEARRRARALLGRLDPRSPERLREARAVQALEYLGTPAARDLLRNLAGGFADARLTEAAKAALARLARLPVTGG